ncbi:MAG TPA: ferric reductase-like transmembrane domain-containing protein [Acidimicrobiales bacterium]|jgi:predicted ferric reductase|nr:ferric reductase-like transmembrane domain-containing protein [Acidimicrobiales bacterium]
MTAAIGGQAMWFLVRGSGIVSLLLLTAGTALGILTSQRWSLTRRIPRFVVGDLHRNLSMLAVAFVALHVVTTIVDGFVPIRWISAVIPFTSWYRGWWLGLGALASDLFLAAAITSAFRRRPPYRAWRTIHLAAYASWPIAVAHSLGTGTDRGEGWMLMLVALCMALIAGLAAWRAFDRLRPLRTRPPAGSLGTQAR